ncbi:MAG: hypothetical protein JNK74_13585 [Candidatus Hydrogenedentes bacterium]|nr:hypothetical protein [Candidatus Hydrogenedentota bacterium]
MPTRRSGWGTALVVWALVAFYLLASARAFVPGLCATQAAIDAQCHTPQGAATISPARRSCCAAKVPATTESCPTDEREPITPSESGCAFCNLLIAHTDPPFAFVMAALPEPAHARPLPLLVQVAPEAPLAAAPNRAPPT